MLPSSFSLYSRTQPFLRCLVPFLSTGQRAAQRRQITCAQVEITRLSTDKYIQSEIVPFIIDTLVHFGKLRGQRVPFIIHTQVYIGGYVM